MLQYVFEERKKAAASPRVTEQFDVNALFALTCRTRIAQRNSHQDHHLDWSWGQTWPYSPLGSPLFNIQSHHLGTCFV